MCYRKDIDCLELLGIQISRFHGFRKCFSHALHNRYFDGKKILSFTVSSIAKERKS